MCYKRIMTNTLTPTNQEWLEQQVKEGTFSSEDEALNMAVETLKSIQTDDLSWAKPYIDEARQEIADGKALDAAPVIAWLRERAAR